MFFSISGLDLFHTQLHDYSISFHEYEKTKCQKEFLYLQSFQNQKMTSIERQSYDVMEYFMNLNFQRDFSEEFSYHNYLINQMNGAQSEIVSFITKFHRILNLKDAEAYLIRVNVLFCMKIISLKLIFFKRYKEYQRHLINLLNNKSKDAVKILKLLDLFFKELSMNLKHFKNN